MFIGTLPVPIKAISRLLNTPVNSFVVDLDPAPWKEKRINLWRINPARELLLVGHANTTPANLVFGPEGTVRTTFGNGGPEILNYEVIPAGTSPTSLAFPQAETGLINSINTVSTLWRALRAPGSRDATGIRMASAGTPTAPNSFQNISTTTSLDFLVIGEALNDWRTFLATTEVPSIQLDSPQDDGNGGFFDVLNPTDTMVFDGMGSLPRFGRKLRSSQIIVRVYDLNGFPFSPSEIPPVEGAGATRYDAQTQVLTVVMPYVSTWRVVVLPIDIGQTSDIFELPNGGSIEIRVNIPTPLCNFQVVSSNSESGDTLLHYYRDDYGTTYTEPGYIQINSVSIDESAGQLVLNVTNQSTGAPFTNLTRGVRVLTIPEKEYVSRIEINGATLPPGTVLTSEFTGAVYGLPPEIYRDADGLEPGRTDSLDFYTAQAETRLTASKDGNLLKYISVPEFNSYRTNPSGGLPLEPWRFNLNVKGLLPVAEDVVLGPAFTGATITSQRTRGYIQYTGGEDGWAVGTSIAWQSANLVQFIINTPNKTIVGTPLSAAVGTADWLSVRSAPWTQLIGEWRITSFDLAHSPTAVAITVEIPGVSDNRYDTTEAAAEVGVFTESPLLDISYSRTEDSKGVPIVGDILQSSLPEDNNAHQVLSTAAGISPFTLRATLSRFQEEIAYDLTKLFYISRNRVIHTSINSYIFLGAPYEVLTQEGTSAVRFTACAMTPAGTTSGQTPLTGTMTTALDGTVEFTLEASVKPAIKFLSPGQRIMITGEAAHFGGAYDILAINADAPELVITSATGPNKEMTAQPATIVPYVLDTCNDDFNINSYNVPTLQMTLADNGAFVPATIPSSTAAAALDFTPQLEQAPRVLREPYSRSVSLSESEYLSNGQETPLKFDGINVMTSGVPNWMPQAFFSVINSGTGNIGSGNPVATVASLVGAKFTLAPGEAGFFAAGQSITTSTGQVLTITSINASNDEVFVDAVIVGVPTTITPTLIYRYYFRIEYIDENGVVASGATFGDRDSVLQFAQASNVQIKLTSLPLFGFRDWNSYQISIFRTLAGQAAPFYRVVTLPLSFVNQDGYILFTDTRADNEFSDTDRDSFVEGRTGAELAPAWTGPLPAKEMTQIGSKLVLGNFESKSSQNLVLQPSGSNPVTAANLNSAVIAFKRDITSTVASSDNINYQAFEFRTQNEITVNSITVGAGTFTVTSAVAHGLAANSWVYLFHSAVAPNNNLQFAGWWLVATAPTPTTFTVNWPSVPASVTGTVVNRMSVAAVNTRNVPVWAGIDGNFATVSGQALSTDVRNIAVYRLALAINAHQRLYPTFTPVNPFTLGPWLSAQAGGYQSTAQIIIERPEWANTTPAVFLANVTNGRWFSFGAIAPVSTDIPFQTLAYGSRILASYANTPEVFDAPFVEIDSLSQSAIDVAPGDGQTITGMIPFFGESAFTASARAAALLVLKQQSAYLVDLNEKAAGRNAVQRLETQGRGCQAPHTVVSTKNGTTFCDASGVYQINQDMQFRNVGQRLGRFWDELDTSRIAEFTAHNALRSSQYQLSAYKKDGTRVQLTYNYAREYLDANGIGSWAIFTGVDFGMAVNQAGTKSVYSLPNGDVVQFRNANTSFDYQGPRGEAFERAVTFRIMDFGAPGIRKLLSSLSLRFRVPTTNILGLTVQTANDNTRQWVDTDKAEIRTPQNNQSGLGDKNNVVLDTVRFTVRNRKATAFQVRLFDARVREDLQLSAVTYQVVALTAKGVKQAAQTTGKE
jgi:hypothetical protein